jgi:hypothetical protein
MEDEDWSSEDIEAEVTGQKRRKGGKGGSKGHRGSSKSRQKKTAAVGELEAAALEEEAAVAELAPQAESWKEKYTILVEENESLRNRVEELMKQANQAAEAVAALPPVAALPVPSIAVNTLPLEMPVPGNVHGGIDAAPIASLASPALEQQQQLPLNKN